MKKRYTFFILFISVFAYAQDATVAKYASMITALELKENLTIIASDALEGRRTGTRGQKMAAAFISNYFSEVGLTGPVNGSYYMPVQLYSIKPGATYVKTSATQFSNFNEVVYMGSTDSGGEVATEVVFAGNGTEGDMSYLNIKDKSVAIITEPFSFSTFSALRKRAAMARDKGAKMIFFIPKGTTEEFKESASQLQSYLSGGSLSIEKSTANNPNKGVFFLSPVVAEKIFTTTTAKLHEYANENVAKKRLNKVKPAKLSYQVKMTTTSVASENVLGFLEGTDKKDEVVIITAHYDHIGKNDGTTGDQINNGADDDGSGTVSVLQMAKAFAHAKKDGKGPRRSILFMTVTGEEEGLLGSEYYSQYPVFPLDKTVVDINIDMIGRRDPEHKGKPDYVYVIGADKLSSELHEINERNNKAYEKLDFDYLYNDENHPTNLYKRSDHWNFAKKGIPIVFFFDGIHEDYHQVTDEVDKIEFDLLAKRARTAFYTAWEVANRDNRLTVDKK
jgi:hypothetical protein